MDGHYSIQPTLTISCGQSTVDGFGHRLCEVQDKQCVNFMDEKFNEATKNRPAGDRLVDSPVVLMDIPSFIKQLKSEKAWDENDRNSITVFKTGKMRIVIVALHKNAEMTTDHPDNVFSLQVIEGKIKLFANNDTVEVRKEQVIALHDKISYRVQALKKSVFLLTLTEGSAQFL